MGKCEETSGVLFRSRCKREAVTTCALSGIAICQECSRPWESGSGAVSISALRKHIAELQERGDMNAVHAYRSDPFFFYATRYDQERYWEGDDELAFDGSDYAIFDGASETYTGGEAGWEGS